ncbi:MAG: trypsin-like peptidase domain-containing protein, partial [Candidatus Gastranaerophilaceae bacterium]
IEGANFGSGFLIDDSGLILTNYHVVKDQEGTLRARFDSGIVIKADIIETSPENDLAIIRVNLNALKQKPYIFSIDNNNETYVGQRVISIGSPIDFAIFDKTLTQGVVSKIDPKIIYHDVAINGGNSGSPLINLDGDVIGINTFIRSDRGQAIGGAIAINRAYKLLEVAKQKVANAQLPSAKFYPDIPAEPYKYSLMNTLFTSEKDLKKFVYSWHWHPKAKGKTYEVFFLTPLERYRTLMLRDKNVLEEVKKQIKSNAINEFDPIGDYEPSYITVFIVPNPDMTTGSRITACTMMAVPFYNCLLIHIPTYNIKFKNKFKSAVLKENNKILSSYSEGKIEFSNQGFRDFYGYTSFTIKTNLVEKSPYYGVFRYDYKHFDTPNELSFEVQSQDGTIDKIIVPEKIKNKIRREFEPYVNYIKKK